MRPEGSHPKAARMQAAVEYVAAHPGATMYAVALHLLGAEIPDPTSLEVKRRQRLHKRAMSVVERVIAQRLVRQADDRLHPWDERLKLYAETLERAATLAPDDARYAIMMALAIGAWREAGDENRAQILDRLAKERMGPAPRAVSEP